MDIEKAIELMAQAAREAGDMLHDMQPRAQRLDAAKDFLSDADLLSENAILGLLQDRYPDIPALSEEAGGDRIMEGYLWIIDPVDGTQNYFSQEDQYGVSIALVHNGQTVAGVIYLPAKKQLFSASSATPATVRIEEEPPRPVHVKETAIRFLIEWGKEEHGGQDHARVYEIIAKLDRYAGYTLPPQIRGSATASMMLVAQGLFAGLVAPKPDPFDIAAACLIVERAGGKVTDMEGNPWTPFSKGIVASNAVAHQDLLRIIRD